jgi:hypothetical protein
VLRWVDSNGAIIDALRDRPFSLADGVFAIEPPKGLLGRLFRKKDETPSAESAPASRPRRERSAEELRRLAETRALVEEALGKRD